MNAKGFDGFSDEELTAFLDGDLPTEHDKLFTLFEIAWNEVPGDSFAHRMARKSLRASHPAFADRMEGRAQDTCPDCGIPYGADGS